MTVRELIELNALITDLEITVRQNGNLLLDQLNIGCSKGIKPPYPTRVPKEARYAGNCNRANDDLYKDAAYIPKPINAWDMGKDYYEIKVKSIPAKWLELEVYGWNCSSASRVTCLSPRRQKTQFHGECLKIIALPNGEQLEIKEAEKSEVEIPGQMSITDFLE